MVLIIIATLLVLAIAAFHFSQGLFSSLIVAILTTLCAALALNFYHPLAASMFPKNSAWAEAVMLALLFGIPFAGIRVGFDFLARKNVVYNVWVDRIGGGILGLWVGIMVTGVLMICLQLLPLDASLMTYKPYDETLQRHQTLGIFAPDETVLKVAGALSRGALRGVNDFQADHADFVLRTFTERNRAGLPTNRTCLEGQFNVLAAYELPADHPWQEQFADVINPMLSPEENHPDNSRIVIIRVGIGNDIQIKKPRPMWMLPATNFHLILPDGTSAWPSAYMAFPNTEARRRLTVGRWHWELFVPRLIEGRPAVTELAVARPASESWSLAELTDSARVSGQGLAIDWVFRLPKVDAPEVDDEDAPAEGAPPVMTMVFRRGLQDTVPQPQLGPPPIEGALSFARAAR
jgi:hypothetical protein